VRWAIDGLLRRVLDGYAQMQGEVEVVKDCFFMTNEATKLLKTKDRVSENRKKRTGFCLKIRQNNAQKGANKPLLTHI